MTTHENHPSIDRVDVSVQRLVRRLGNRYLAVLMVVAVLVVVDQAVIQPLLMRFNLYAPTINLAGRQRMLSQKLAKAALAWQAAGDDASRQFRRDELHATLAQWSDAHAALQQGAPDRDVLPLGASEIGLAWSELQPHFTAMCVAAEQIASDPVSSPKAVVQITEHESAYLAAMDRVVGLLEDSAGRQIALLRLGALSIALAVIVLLLGLGWFVVRPATRTIRTQIDELEFRVTERTRELAAANDTLQREMADRQQAEIKNQQLAAQLAHAARVTSLGHLASGLSHELNQPLAAIVNFTETCDLLLSRLLPPEREPLVHPLEGIKESALRAGKIIHRMRAFLRPQAGSAVSVELNALIGEVLDLCRFELDRSEVTLSLDLWPQGFPVEVDPIQIQQVLLNLVQNGLQAMRGCPPLQRRLLIRSYVASSVEDVPQARIDVIDSGPGLRGLDDETLFAPFQTTKPDGLGIGLTICRSIVERYRGSIHAQPCPDGGAMFSFCLPCQVHDVHAAESRECLCR